MIFKKLELRNFKSHATSSIDFNTGITLVVGENGAGKSSIFDAITFALFKQSKAKISDLVRTNKGLDERIEMEVKLTFSSDGVDYRVERKVPKNGNSTAKLIRITDVREETIASTVTEVGKEIEQILSMDSSTFLNAIHIKQGQISELFDKTAAERKELISQLLRLNDLENAYKRLPEISREKTRERDKLSGKIENNGDLDKQLSDAKKERETLFEQNEVLNGNLGEINRELETKTKEKDELDLLKEKFNKMNLEKKHQEGNLEKLNESKVKLELDLNKILDDEKNMEILKPYCEKLETYKEFKESFSMFNILKKEESSKNDMIEKIRENKSILSNEKESHDRYIELNGEMDKLKKEEIELTSDVKHADRLETRKNNIIDEFNHANQKLDEFNNKFNDVLSNFGITSADSIKTDEDLKDLKGIVENLMAEKEKELDQTESEFNGFNDEKIRLAQQSDSSRESLDDLEEVEDECPICHSKITEDRKESLIKGYENSIAENDRRIGELKELMDDLDVKKSDIDIKLNSLKSILNDFKEIKIHIKQIFKSNGELEEIELQINEIQTKKRKLEELAPVLTSKMDEFESLKPHHEEYVKAETLLNSLDDETKVEDELKTISNQIDEAEGKLKDLINLESDLSLEIGEEELNKNIAFLTEKNSDYHFLMGNVARKDEVEGNIKSNSDEIATKIKEIEDIAKQIESCGYDEKVHEDLDNLVKELSEKSSSLNTQIEVNRTQLKNKDERINEIECRIEENKQYIEKYEALDEYIDLLNDFRWHYSKDGIQKELRAQSKPLIQKYTRDFFEKFNFNYSDLILDDDYNISVFGPEGKVNLDMVSGGEEIAIALSLRLGIAQLMSKGIIETILLDEPTVHLDAYRKQELIEVFRSMTTIPQMIIVTHDSELETAADRIIKVKKDDGISKIEDNS